MIPYDATRFERLTYLKARTLQRSNLEICMEVVKRLVSVALAALTKIGIMRASAEKTSAVAYGTYVGYPANCVVRPA